MVAEIVYYFHVISLALWFGGLFGYVMIVWPALFKVEAGGFPRTDLATIGMRTGPWIYLAMISALVSFLVYWLGGFGAVSGTAAWIYLVVLIGLIGNNVYGTLVAWPRIMVSPEQAARGHWKQFYLRMSISLVVGLSMLSVAVIAK